MNELQIHVLRTETIRNMDCTRLSRCLPARFERAMRYRFERDRLLCLGAGLLMMDVMGIHDERELRCGPFGKPYVPGKPSFSISHSGSICILACGEASHIGADIEVIDERQLEIAQAVLTEKELDWMRQGPPEKKLTCMKPDPVERFFRLWTWKESVMKATGIGMQLSPSGFEVLPFAEGKPARIMGRSWYAWAGHLDQSCVSICADEPIGQVRLIEY